MNVASGDCFVRRQLDDLSDWRQFEEVEHQREEGTRSQGLAHTKVIDSELPPTFEKLMVFSSQAFNFHCLHVLDNHPLDIGPDLIGERPSMVHNTMHRRNIYTRQDRQFRSISQVHKFLLDSLGDLLSAFRSPCPYRPAFARAKKSTQIPSLASKP